MMCVNTSANGYSSPNYCRQLANLSMGHGGLLFVFDIWSKTLKKQSYALLLT